MTHNCRWSKTPNGAAKTRSVKTVSRGWDTKTGDGVVHSTRGLVITTTDGEHLKVIAADSAQQRQWSAACRAMLQAHHAAASKKRTSRGRKRAVARCDELHGGGIFLSTGLGRTGQHGPHVVQQMPLVGAGVGSSEMAGCGDYTRGGIILFDCSNLSLIAFCSWIEF